MGRIAGTVVDLLGVAFKCRDLGERHELMPREPTFRRDHAHLVQVSFVENIGPWNDDGAAFVESWLESLKRDVERQRNSKPGDPGPVGML